MKKVETQSLGYIAALVTVMFWGMTFISTKILLAWMTPIEILLIRFVMGWLILLAFSRKRLPFVSFKEELLFAGAGATGVTFYFLLENIALTYTTTANVGIIVSVAPFFTVLFSWLFLKSERISWRYLIGFLIAFIGIILISSANQSAAGFHLKGDLLALSAAVCWGFYSIFTKKIGALGYDNITATRKTFTYGLILMIPLAFFMGFHVEAALFTRGEVWLNLIFLGAGASAFCFVSWNFAIKVLGAIKSSAYIYLVPVITVVASAGLLKEEIYWQHVAGILLTILGLIFSEYQPRKKMAPEKRPE